MTDAHDGYLENEVLSASPARLHLLLVEGAMRYAEQARQHWADGRNDLACDALIRAQEIVTEMVGGLNREGARELTDRLAGIYLFVFRALVHAGLGHDAKQLDEALRVLDIERDTWRMVCERLKPQADGQADSASAGAALPPYFAGLSDVDRSGFSLEA